MRVDEFIDHVKSDLRLHQSNGLGLRELSKECGVSASLLSRFLNGKEISLSNFVRISRAMDAIWEKPE